MYDSAKRSLAFAVATGGLLLTGTVYSPALAAAGPGAIQGQAQARGVPVDAGSASSPVNAAHRDVTAASPRARAAQAPPGSLPPEVSRPYLPAPAAAGGAAADTPIPACGDTVSVLIVRDGTGWTYCAADSGPAGTGAAPAGAAQGPAGMLIQVCGNTVTAVPTESFESGSSCTNTAEGSAPTVPGAPASGTGGASATAVSVHDGSAAPAAGTTIAGRSGGTGSRDVVAVPRNALVTDCAGMGDTGVDGHGDGRCEPSPAWPSASASSTPCHCSPGAPRHPSPPPIRHPGKCNCPHTAPVAPPPPPPAGWHPSKCPCSHTSPAPPPSWPAPPSKCPCPTSPPTSPPPSGWPSPSHGWPSGWPSPSSSHGWPSGWPSPSSSHGWPSGWPSPPSASPSGSSWHHPGGPPHNGNGGGGLAHTGTDIGIALGVAGAALLGGLGLRAAARRREGQN